MLVTTLVFHIKNYIISWIYYFHANKLYIFILSYLFFEIFYFSEKKNINNQYIWVNIGTNFRPRNTLYLSFMLFNLIRWITSMICSKFSFHSVIFSFHFHFISILNPDILTRDSSLWSIMNKSWRETDTIKMFFSSCNKSSPP